MKLTPLQPTDIQTLRAWLSDESLFRVLAVEPPDLSKPYYCFVIRLNDGTAVGWIDVFNVDLQNRKCEAGIAIPHRRGRGLSLRAARQALRWMFEALQLNRVTLRIPMNNTRSIKLAEMLGFQREGVERQSCCRGGSYEDIVVYGLLKQDFKGR